MIRTAGDPAVVEAAIHPLYYAGADTITEAANVMVNPSRGEPNEKIADALGNLMGAAALSFPSIADLLRNWLKSPPNGGFLSSPTALNEYVRGVAFSMKEVAHRNKEIDPVVYASFASALWGVWRSPRSVSGEGRHSLSLYLMSPLQEYERGESIAARYWPRLRALFVQILASAEADEVYSALFDLDIDGLLPIALREIASILQDAALTAMKAAGKGSLNSEGRIAQVLCEVASHKTCTREIASEIHQTLLITRARKEALDVERRWRDRSGL